VAGSDNPNCEGYLAEMQKRCEGNDNITFYGYVEEEDVPLLFRDSHVAVFPYTATTGSSGVLHQAGSYGRACVLPRFGDFVDLIDHEGYAAELFEPGDAPSLAQALHRVIADQQLMHGIGETNYLAASSLPMQEIAAWYELQLRAVLTNKGKRRGTHGLGHWHVGNAAAA